MKNVFKRGLAMLLIVVILVSSLCISSFAATSRPSANAGIREQVCTTFDGTNAPSYYTGDYTYSALSSLSPDALLLELRELMSDTHKTLSDYRANCRNHAGYTDCEGSDYTHFTTLYSDYSFPYTEGDDCSGWNREHVWPQSLGGFGTSGGGADLHHIRPTESTPNGTRGNDPYGEVNGGSAVYGNVSGNLAGYSGGGLFEPLDYAKGDVARICLYVYVRWGGTSGYTCNDIGKVFESVDTLLAWCALDPVDTWEMERNDSVHGVQGNRNVFIDYPELAWKLFGRTVPENLTSPSDNVDNGTAGGGNGGDNTGSGDSGATTPDVPEVSTTAPVVGSDYNLTAALGNGTVYYVGKTISSKTFSTTQNIEEAGVFGVEKTSSGNYVLYIKKDSNAKKYIVIADAPQGFSETDSASDATPLVWNAEKETLVAADSDNNRWFGTSGGVDFRAYVITGSYSFAKFAPLNADSGDTGGDNNENDDDYVDVPTVPNPDDEIGGESGNGGNTGGSNTVSGEVVFEFGENGSASHSDGGNDTNTYSQTSGDYTLNITGGSKFYPNARDQKGNSAIKLGSSGNAGKFSFTVPDGVKSVVLKVAGYKNSTAKLTVNGTSYTVSTVSNNGEYTDIVIDTTSTKTINVSTASGGYRAMLNSITFVFEAESNAGGCASGDHNENEHGYCKDCQVVIKTATLIISEDLSLRFGVDVIDKALLSGGKLSMKFMFNGKTYEVSEYSTSDGRYVFIFDGIGPNQMTMLLDVEFCIGGVVIASYDDYSVEANLLAVREKNATDKALVQLIDDTLLYGRAAQNYTNTNTSDLAGEGVNLGASASNPTASDAMTLTGNENEYVYFASVGVHFDYVNSIYVKITVTDTSRFGSLTVDGKSYALSDLTYVGNNQYRLDLAPACSTEFGKTVNMTLTGADSATLATIKYSVNSYAYAMVNGECEVGSAMYELALALYRYGKSSVAYCLAND